MQTVAQRMSELLQAMRNCEKSGNDEWHKKHKAELAQLVREKMPSWAGFDNGTNLFMDSDPQCLEFQTAFYHMDDAGYYDGWTKHEVKVRPMFSGFSVHVSGKDKNDIKEHIAQVFYDALSEVLTAKGNME